MVNLNLGYSFFYELAGGSGAVPGGDQPAAGDPVQRRRRRRRQGGMTQKVEMRFRLVELRTSVLLYSSTSSSVHLIRVSLHNKCVECHKRRGFEWYC